MKIFSSNSLYVAALALVALAGMGAYAFANGGALLGNPSSGAARATGTVAPDTSGGSLAPDFALERLSGETFHLSDHRGKVVAINVWATWCPPCREEIPDLIEVQKQMRGEVLFVGVSIDKGGPEKVRAFAEEFGINYPVVIDDGTVVRKYGPMPGIPTTIFVGPRGKVRTRAIGLLTEENVRPVLKALAEGEELKNLEPPFQRATSSGD